ncbi:MAG: efflux RND transporter periplasmic adaptor subunit [Xenococcaceae cyanobacterium]
MQQHSEAMNNNKLIQETSKIDSKPEESSAAAAQTSLTQSWSPTSGNHKGLRSSAVGWKGVATSAVLLLVGLGAGLGIGLTTRSPNSSPEVAVTSSAKVMPVRTLRLEPVKSYQVKRTYTGEVVAPRASELGFERGGKLIKLRVDDGDRVTAGMPLAQLDTRNLAAQRQAIVAQRAQAVARLEELRAGPRVEQIAAARAAVRDLEEQLALSEAQRARREFLLREGAISREQLDQFTFNTGALKARLDAAQSNLDELLAGTRKEQIAAQSALVKQLDASLADINVSLEKSVLRAPFAGEIAVRRVDEGAVVEAGQPVLRLVENTTLEVRVGVPADTIAQLKLGRRQTVKIAEQPYQAQVSAVLPEVDPVTRTRTVVLRLSASSVAVAPGEVARLQLITNSIATTGYWLPITALVRGDRGLWSCYVLAPTDAATSAADAYQIERRDVEILHTESDRVLVRGTLQPGESLIASGVHRIVPGQLVRPIEPGTDI